MKKIKSFKKILVLLFILAIAIFGLHYIAYNDIKSKNQNISILQNELSLYSNKQDYLVSTEKILSGKEAELKKANNSIVSKKGEIKFIENLENIARQNGLEIEILSLVVSNEKLHSSDLEILNIKIKTEGTWTGSYTFLAEMESLPTKVKIKKSSLVSLNSTDVKSEIWRGLFEISVLKNK